MQQHLSLEAATVGVKCGGCHIQVKGQTKQEIHLKKIHLSCAYSSNFCIVSIVVIPEIFKTHQEILEILAQFPYELSKKKKNVKLKKLSVMFEVGKWQEKESNHEAFYFPREFHMDTHPSSFSQDSSSRSKHFQRKALMIQRNSNQKPWILHLGFSLFSSLRNLNSKKWNPN